MTKILWVALTLAPGLAQSQQPAATATFEAATVKPHKPDAGPFRVTTAVEPGGIRFTNVNLKSCIRKAYGLRTYQIAGGPGWVNEDRFDIVARAAGAASEDQFMAMLQSLLEERFQLKFHRENREIPVYSLVAGKKGVKIQPVKDDESGEWIGGDDQHPISVRNLSMAGFAAVLARAQQVDRPVQDKTGLKGVFTFSLNFVPKEPGGPDTEPPDGPSIFTALQEQLGLKLEPAKGAVEILVIDRAERPSAN